MSKQFICWGCGRNAGVLFTRGFGTHEEYKICGSCVGYFAAIDCRLNEISRCGKLPEHLTANTPDVPECEKQIQE